MLQLCQLSMSVLFVQRSHLTVTGLPHDSRHAMLKDELLKLAPPVGQRKQVLCQWKEAKQGRGGGGKGGGAGEVCSRSQSIQPVQLAWLGCYP